MDRDNVQKQTGRVREADKLGCLATEEEENKCALINMLSAFVLPFTWHGHTHVSGLGF